jgi:hypothetical protein
MALRAAPQADGGRHLRLPFEIGRQKSVRGGAG